MYQEETALEITSVLSLSAVGKKSFSILYILIILIGFVLTKRRPLCLDTLSMYSDVCDFLVVFVVTLVRSFRLVGMDSFFSTDLKNKKGGKARCQHSTKFH